MGRSSFVSFRVLGIVLGLSTGCATSGTISHGYGPSDYAQSSFAVRAQAGAPATLTGADLLSVDVRKADRCMLHLVFTAIGRERFANLTQSRVGQTVQVLVGERVLLQPMVHETVSRGRLEVPWDRTPCDQAMATFVQPAAPKGPGGTTPRKTARLVTLGVRGGHSPGDLLSSVKSAPALATPQRQSQGARVRIEVVRTTATGPQTQALERVFRRRKKMLQKCYEHRTAQTPVPAETLILDTRINGRGRLQSVTVVDDTLRQPKVRECVVKKIRRVRFPARERSDELRIEISFEAAADSR
jgi:hypothetical protein